MPESPTPTRPHGIETFYNGTLYRSRLEARWAAFFDILGWPNVYEPIDADGYIPDFLVGGCLLVEVKPAHTHQQLLAHRHRIQQAIEAHWDGDLILLGVSPYLAAGRIWEEHTMAGAILHRMPDDDLGDWADDTLVWSTVGDHWGLWSERLCLWTRPGPSWRGDMASAGDQLDLKRMWGEAHLLTRWTPEAV